MVRRPAVPMRQHLMAELAGQLTAEGWHLSPPAVLASQTWAIFTSERPNGLLATLSVAITERADTLSVLTTAGVGYRPASSLGAALTLRSYSAHLIANTSVERTVQASAPAAALVVRREADAGWHELADSFSGAEALLDRLIASLGNEPTSRRRPLQNCFLVAGAMGRLEDAAGFLTLMESRPDGGSQQRFLRQARRWLDAGAPAVPLLSDDELGAHPPHLPSGADLRRFVRKLLERTVATRDAERRLRRRIRREPTATTAELRTGFTADLQAHGHHIAPPSAALTVATSRRLHQPFGSVRQKVYEARVLAGLTVLIGTAIQRRELPAPMIPGTKPAHAAFPVKADRERWTEVILDDTGIATLRALAAQNAFRVGPQTTCKAWLTDGGPQRPLEVHVGTHRVGRLDPEASRAFRPVMEAAAGLDEVPELTGTFADLDEPLLALPLPAEDAANYPYR